ncbi:hypothetical protein DPMN_006333 [Dreissena polymorpha]|uniref:Uncharacterized protein n=1 Tax=Dreissena polymorpha TaxID=45954 RepID=A0A9D4MS74_DREPO|nr:hypothetical protein DPMN_006333 [Dreissena polymorpha]
MARQTPHDPGVPQVEIERIVIREVRYQLDVNRCRNGEIIVKGNFGWAWPMWAGNPKIIRIAIREVQYQFEDIRCKNFPPPSSHVIQLTGTIFELNSRIKETNVLCKFHENWAKNVTSTMFTQKCPPTDSHVSSPIRTIFKLTNFHDDWVKIVTSRPNRENCHYIHIEKNASPTGDHVFSPISTIFKLVQDINRTNVLTNFHDDWAKIVTSRVFTRKIAPPPTGGHVFQRIGTTFDLNQDIIKKNILTKIFDTDGRTDRRTDGQTDGRTDRRGVYHNTSRHRRAYKKCRFQGSSAYSVGGESGQDRQTDGRK